MIALLCALPACVALIESWPLLWWSTVTNHAVPLARRIAFAAAIAGIAPLVALVASGWNVQIALLTATIVVGATGGLVAVQHVLGSRLPPTSL